MSFREVTSLRKAGRLDEAYAMAAHDLDREVSEWTLSAMFWVERDLCNRFLDTGDAERAREKYDHLKQLLSDMNDDQGYAKNAMDKLSQRMDPFHDQIQELTEASKNGKEEEAYTGMKGLCQNNPLPDAFHENYGWIIYRYLKKSQQSLSTTEIEGILSDYLNLHVDRPSNLHSLILGQSGKVSERHHDFNLLKFVEQWGVENLQDEDFESSEWNEKKMEPRVSRLIEYCFKHGYSIEEVSRVFTSNDRISQEDIYEHFSRQRFFDLNKQKNDVRAFLRSVRAYFDAVEGLPIKNHHHSIILALYLKKNSDDPNGEIPSSIEKWGWNNFRTEDWEREKGENGKTFPSLVEKVIKGYMISVKRRAYVDVGEDFERLLRQAINKYDNDEHERSLAKILQARGEREKALAIYRRLLLTMNKYYVWKELSELTDDRELKISALCKAILAEPNDDYLGDVHLALAELMLEEGHPLEARCELGRYNSTYIKNRWKPKPEFREIAAKVLHASWNGQIPKDNKEYYLSHTQAAEEFVYADLPWRTMAVTEVFTVERYGKKKKRARLVSKKGKSLVVNLRLLPGKAVVGQCYDVKTCRDGGKDRVVLSRKSDKKAEDILRRKGYSSIS